MNFEMNIKTKVLFGKNILENNKSVLKSTGSKAFIVTGNQSGEKSGALNDIKNILTELKIEFCVFNDVVNNPTMPNVARAGKEAKAFGADFVIGIGGGSPLDAAKAIAVLAVNDIEPLALYDGNFPVKPLPVIAIPTTVGTGSEVTPYSILTRPDLETKKSFSDESLFPVYAMLDPRYTYSLPFDILVGTAYDAFSHAIEGYLSNKATFLSDFFALKAINIFGSVFDSFIKRDISKYDREQLLLMSMLAGIVIVHTGTTILHGMGYCLTYFKDIPHGTANGLLMIEYLKQACSGPVNRVLDILKILECANIEEFENKMKRVSYEKPLISNEEIKKYTEIVLKQKSADRTSFKINEEILERMFINALGKD
jgi:alcohol dehydrogenase class IV